MKIKLGIAPIAWSNDDMPELGGDTPIEQCLEEASLAGFTGIELGGKFPRNPGITNFLLEKYNLKMPGGWYGSLLRRRSANDEWAAMRDHLNLLKMVKADVFVFADVSGSIKEIKQESYLHVPIWMMMNLQNIVKKLMKFPTDFMMKEFQCLIMNIWGQLFKRNMMLTGLWRIPMIILFYFMTLDIYYLRKQTLKEY